MFKQYKTGIIPIAIYQEYNNISFKLLKKAKVKYYNTKQIESNGNIKKTWRVINTLSNLSKTKTDKIKLTINNDNEVNDPGEVANLFCDHFSSIATKFDA